MNPIVRDHYPASKLPEDLREGLEPNDEVRVTLESIDAQSEEAPSNKSRDGSFSARYKHLRRANFSSDSDVDAYVRGPRDD